jgi:hypothetical protein
MLLDLPQDAWCSISLHLSTPDVLAFLSTHGNINRHLSSSPAFWSSLLARDRDETDETAHINKCVDDIRKEFMLHSYQSALPAVKWMPLNTTFPISEREGHISCVLQGPNNYRSLIVTGGFCDDENIAVMRLPRGHNSHSQTWGWTLVNPTSTFVSFAYGATLTPLPPIDSGSETINIAKAVRFGGFQGGGYSHETNEVWVLTVYDEWKTEERRAIHTVDWQKVETTGFKPQARAYHTATMIHDRYLLIIGGMTSDGCVMEEAILDTHTWEWQDISLATTGHPPARHGHSVVLDNRRNRLVMFGGGTGTDLLRSGVDNNEVWELKMNGIDVPENLDDSKVWEWRRLYKDTIFGDDDNDSDDEMEFDGDNTDALHNLSLAESLCLGRCHNCFKIAPDTALFMFGGGRSNTNGVLAYNLRTDSFLRPKVFGPLAFPRFTAAATFLDTEGYVFVHGGFNTNLGRTILDVNLLDVAPYLERNFTSLPIDARRESQRAITDQEAQGASMIRGALNHAAIARALIYDLLYGDATDPY